MATKQLDYIQDTDEWKASWKKAGEEFAKAAQDCTDRVIIESFTETTMAKKTKFGKYGNPFKPSREQARHARRQRLEATATVIKKMTGDKRPIKHIAADLSLAEMRRKK